MLHGNACFDHRYPELVLIFLVGVHLYRVAPRVHMAPHAAVILQVPRGAQKDPARMHQLAERKTRGEHGDEEKVDEEESAQLGGYDGFKAHKPHDQLFHPLHVRLKEMAHEDAGEQDRPEEEKGKIVGRQRNEAQLGTEALRTNRYVTATRMSMSLT